MIRGKNGSLFGFDEVALVIVMCVERPAGPKAMPSAVIDRGRRYRARLGANGLELETGGPHSFPDRTDSVLAIGVLEGDQRSLEEELRAIRGSLRPGAELWLVERTCPVRTGSFTTRARSRLRTRTNEAEATARDTVGALRAAGWTICSIERFETVAPDDVSTWWVDVVATDLSAESVR